MKRKCNIIQKKCCFIFFWDGNEKNFSNTCPINSNSFLKLVIYCIVQVAIIVMMLYYAVLLLKKGIFSKVENIFHDKISKRVASLHSKAIYFNKMTTTDPSWLTIWRIMMMPQYILSKSMTQLFSMIWRHTKKRPFI